VLLNPQNWLALYRASYVFVNPAQFLRAMITRQAPPSVLIRSPIGRRRICLRNFESLRTLFSIFCRLDYRTDGASARTFVDIGANIGLASLYFLSRHPHSSVEAYEPDQANLELLRRNLLDFGGRARVNECAVGVDAQSTLLYRSEDGKYSSLLRSERANLPQEIETQAFGDVLARACEAQRPVVVKIDVEGLEEALVGSVDFNRYGALRRLIVESTGCARLVGRPHRRIVRSGYVEDIRFEGPESAPG